MEFEVADSRGKMWAILSIQVIERKLEQNSERSYFQGKLPGVIDGFWGGRGFELYSKC